MWNDQERAQSLGRERASLEAVVVTLQSLFSGLDDAADLLAMAVDEGDDSAVSDIEADIDNYERQVSELEFRRMFSGETDHCNAFLDIQAGSGGTEAQDWAEMLLRMYLR